MQEAMPATEVVQDYDLDRIMAELDDFGGKYPKAAIAAARQHREAVTPRLIEALDDAVAVLQDNGEADGDAAFFALLLLGEFGAKSALPSILRALTLPAQQPFDLFGDSLHEHVPQILSALSETPEVIDRIIEDRSLDEYVRGSAASAYVQMVYDGKLSRDEAVSRLRQHLKNSIEHRDAHGANWQVNYLYDLSPHEALDDIREAYRLDLVDEGLLDLESIEESLSNGEDRFTKAMQDIAWRRKTLPADYVDCFNWERDEKPVSRSPVPPPPPHWTSETDDDGPNNAPSTIRYTEARVGRNDPCPCGSGKKFKKCCSGH